MSEFPNFYFALYMRAVGAGETLPETNVITHMPQQFNLSNVVEQFGREPDCESG